MPAEVYHRIEVELVKLEIFRDYSAQDRRDPFDLAVKSDLSFEANFAGYNECAAPEERRPVRLPTPSLQGWVRNTRELKGPTARRFEFKLSGRWP